MAKAIIEEFSFTQEDNVASACSGALRRAKKLSECAPMGKLFAAITTLSETAQAANEALNHQHLQQAAAHLRTYGMDDAANHAPLSLPLRRRG